MAAETLDSVAELVLAEDDPDDRFIILRALRRIRPTLRVVEVRDGVELVEYLASRTEGVLPGLVLLDLNMPRMTGREALAMMRADGRLRGLPVAVMSTSIEPEDMRSVQALGVSAFMSKPDGFAALVHVMEKLLGDHFGRAPGVED
jgi:two-component system response regulator